MFERFVNGLRPRIYKIVDINLLQIDNNQCTVSIDLNAGLGRERHVIELNRKHNDIIGTIRGFDGNRDAVIIANEISDIVLGFYGFEKVESLDSSSLSWSIYKHFPVTKDCCLKTERRSWNKFDYTYKGKTFKGSKLQLKLNFNFDAILNKDIILHKWVF